MTQANTLSTITSTSHCTEVDASDDGDDPHYFPVYLLLIVCEGLQSPLRHPSSEPRPPRTPWGKEAKQ